MRNQTLEQKFPKLRKGRYDITSPQDINYNCFAWAAGESNIFISPHPSYHWPKSISRGFDLRAFIMLYESFGYKVCESRKFEPGYEKVAIFVDGSSNPKHAARQLSSGDWTSKLGSAEDIQHRLSDLEGKIYGKVAKILRRRKH